MPGYFDFWTVLFSFVIASLAGFVAFESIDHTRYSEHPERWTLISGMTLGLGIWSMHFIGMLAWQPPFPLYYALGRTLSSVLAAVAASWLAMRITVRHKAGAPRHNLLLGALAVGTGICGMHYIGMSALQFNLPVVWDRSWVLLSFAVAVTASLGALELLRRSAGDDFGIKSQVAASLVLGLAICGMHYVGMHAMMLQPGSICQWQRGAFSGSALARIGVGNALVFTICLLVVFYQDKVRLLHTASEARFQAQEASRKAERLGAAGKIAASISHEINNPLEAVTNLLYLVERGDIGKTELDYLQAAQDELKRIAEITTHTLKFYRQQSAPASTELPELVESALAVFAKRLQQSSISVEKRWSSEAPKVVCRAGEIRQVFANLIGNAIDAMPTGGSLLLAVRADGEGAEVEVSDTGQGISEEAQKKIFEPFFTTKGVSGTGLGLSICAEILERHGGTLRFSSSTVSGHSGTRFTLYLPPSLQAVPSSQPVATKREPSFLNRRSSPWRQRTHHAVTKLRGRTKPLTIQGDQPAPSA